MYLGTRQFQKEGVPFLRVLKIPGLHLRMAFLHVPDQHAEPLVEILASKQVDPQEDPIIEDQSK